MSKNCEKMCIALSTSQGYVFRCVVLFNQMSKIQRYSVFPIICDGKMEP